MKILREAAYVACFSLSSMAAFATTSQPDLGAVSSQITTNLANNKDCGAINPSDTLSAKLPGNSPHYGSNFGGLTVDQQYPSDVDYKCSNDTSNLSIQDRYYVTQLGNSYSMLCKGSFTYKFTVPSGSTCPASPISPNFYVTTNNVGAFPYVFQSNLFLTHITIDKKSGLMKAVYGGGTFNMVTDDAVNDTVPNSWNSPSVVNITVLYPLPQFYTLNAGCAGAADFNSGKTQVSTTTIRDTKGNKTGASCSVEANVGTTP